MHTGPVSGDYTSDWRPVVIAGVVCRKCGGQLRYRDWESSCGGFEDQEINCTACDHTYWVEGPDA